MMGKTLHNVIFLLCVGVWSFILVQASQTVAVDQTVLTNDAPTIPSRIELSKNFSIISAEDIPSLLEEEQQQRHHYP